MKRRVIATTCAALLGALVALPSTASAAVNLSTKVRFSAAVSDDVRSAPIYCGGSAIPAGPSSPAQPAQPTCASQGITTTQPYQARWGLAASGSTTDQNQRSGVGFQPTPAGAVDVNSTFQLGALTHFNFPIYYAANSVDMTVYVTLTDGSTLLTDGPVPVRINITETPNEGLAANCPFPSAAPCSDRITYTLPQPTVIHTVDHTYALSLLGFKESPNAASAPITAFFSEEGQARTGYLFAQLVDTNQQTRAKNDEFGTSMGLARSVLAPGVRANDVGVDTVTVADQPHHGTVTMQPTGAFTYTPVAGYVGDDTFTYVGVHNGELSLATVTMHVIQPKPAVTGLPPVQTHLEATGPNGASFSWSDPIATNYDGSTVPVTCNPVSGSVFAIGVRSVFCTATNSAGTTQREFIVFVDDTTRPTFTGGSSDVTLEATSSAGAQLDRGIPTATDAVDDSVSVTCNHAASAPYAIGSTLVTCTATDDAGNSAQTSFTVKVVDTAAPTFAGVPDDLTVEAASSAGGAATFTTPTATDVVTGSVPVTCTHASGDVLPLGSTTVTCSASDAAHNAASVSFDVLVHDTTAPVIVGTPDDATAEAASSSGAAVSYTAPTALDTVDASATVSCTPASGSVFALGSTTVTCSAVDAAGNSATSSFEITVTDTTAPVISGTPAGATVEATSAAGAAVTFAAPTALDLVDGAATVTCSPASGDVLAVGTTTVTCTATDAAGNSSHTSFDAHVVDTTAPVLAGVPSDLTVEATSAAGATVTFDQPTATDIVDGTVTVSCSSSAAGSTMPLGDTTVACLATDAHGNGTSTSFAVHVVDTTAPAVTPLAMAPVALAQSSTGAMVSWLTPTATDAVSGSVAVTCSPTSGSMFPVGQTSVTCSATDAAHNTGSTSFTVTVQDAQAPVLTVPGTITKDATGPAGATATYVASAVDNVDGSVPVTCTKASGSTFAIGNTTVTCTATDHAGNSATGSFTVHVRSALEQVNALLAAVQGVGPGASLESKVTKLRNDIAAGNKAASCSDITPFLNELRAQSGKKVTPASAAAFAETATRIGAVLGC